MLHNLSFAKLMIFQKNAKKNIYKFTLMMKNLLQPIPDSTFVAFCGTNQLRLLFII